MHGSQHAQLVSPPVTALDCGIPVDSHYFDDSKIVELPAVGASALLARVDLPPQYCGVLEYFSQFTDLFSRDSTEVKTPGLLWQILANGQPLSPYHQVAAIINPWGFGSFQFSIRLPEGATVEMVVRRSSSNVASAGKVINTVGGRLLGRYWYNGAYGAPPSAMR
jgi:hypothetical protein